MSVEVATLTAVFGADISGFNNAARQVENRLTSISNGMQNAGARIMGTGASLALAFGPASVAMGKMLSSATSFERSLSNIAAVSGLTKDETKKLGDELLALGMQSTVGPQAVANAYYDIAGGVVDATKRMDVLNAAIATAEAGQADLSGTTSALISVMNSYATSNLNAATASDVMTRTVGMGVGTMNEFATAMPQVTGLAASLGISFEDVGASMAFLTTKGFSASEAATMLSSSMVALIRPNQEMADAIERAGYASGQAMIDALGLQGAYQQLAANGEDIAGITGRVEALRGVTAMLGSDAPVFLAEFKTGVEGATEAARAIQLEGFGARWDRLKSQISGVSIQIGQLLLPGLQRLADIISPIIQRISEWAAANPELASTIVAIVGGLGALGAAMLVIGPIISGVGVIIGALMSPIVLIGIAVAALAYIVVTNWDTITNAVTEGWNWIKDKVSDIPNILSGVATDVYNAAKNLGAQLLQGLIDALASLGTWIANTINDAIPDKIDLGPLGSVKIGNPFDTGGGGGGGGATGSTNWFMSGDFYKSVYAAAAARGGGGSGQTPIAERAAGGPVFAGTPYLVGERGPELFVPGRSGAIIPNGAGGPTVINLMLPSGEVVYTAVVNEGVRRNNPVFMGAR